MKRICSLLVCFFMLSCSDKGADPVTLAAGRFQTDQQVFAFITQSDPFGLYALFPHADSVVAGTLNGSTAHNPLVRVSLNARAVGSLTNGRFVPGTVFAESSVVFKEIRQNDATVLYAVMVKERANGRAGGGWLWGEYGPDGTVVYSMQNGGAACTGCHALEQGPSHDLVRTFERQSP